MTRSAHITAFFAAVAACLAVSGCGGDDTGDLIPRAKADELERRIDAIEQAVDDRCAGLDGRVADAQTTVGSLDEDGVGEDVQDALADGIEGLRGLADRDCEFQEPEETIPETVPIDPVPPPTTTETIVPEPPEPEPEPEEEEDEEEPPSDEGEGGDQFEPPGNGGAGPPGLEKKE